MTITKQEKPEIFKFHLVTGKTAIGGDFVRLQEYNDLFAKYVDLKLRLEDCLLSKEE